MYIKHTLRAWSDKHEDLFFKSPNRFRILNISIELKKMDGKEILSEVFLFNFKKEMFFWFLLTHVDKTLGIMSKRKKECSFF